MCVCIYSQKVFVIDIFISRLEFLKKSKLIIYPFPQKLRKSWDL